MTVSTADTVFMIAGVIVFVEIFTFLGVTLYIKQDRHHFEHLRMMCLGLVSWLGLV